MQQKYQIDHHQLREFFEKGMAFMAALKKTDPKMEFPSIQLGEPEFDAWHQYFEHHLGRVPYVMKMAMTNENQTMTVPTRWPQWFDTSYAREAAE